MKDLDMHSLLRPALVLFIALTLSPESLIRSRSPASPSLFPRAPTVR
jgi:hypothetical protein